MPFDPTVAPQSMYFAPNSNQPLAYIPSEAPTFDPNNYVPTTSTQMTYESTGTEQMTFEPSQTTSEPNNYPPMTFNPTEAPPPAQPHWANQPVEGGGLTLGQGHQEPVESHDSQGTKEVNKEEKKKKETKGSKVDL